MKEQKFEFNYQVFDSIAEMMEADKNLLLEARKATNKSYAPYSHFHVGAAALLANGEILSGANQENAAYPMALCAERVLLATVSSDYPETPIEVMAISYQGEGQPSDHPISPCGMCRQSLQEFEGRMKHPIRLILGGMEGPVYVIENVSQLLPLAFTSEELK
ncbi:cytidine deaminase [Cnuella takakiae]|uniref:Cytidine deaminase n=1 Tax=Cnuella takakiae TaxID=1302690 RepID=A0A1M4V024_9BACT|nr:cytidine deaminase [Cnuella takakiae]OLY92746.1 cytidine deaminase [Cnuella takakiae]SHE62237.1 cytidine deaminase [Cnuella takakiae]